MNQVEIVKNVIAVATPLTKVLVDTWISPKLLELKQRYNSKTRPLDHTFVNKFVDYLNERYKTYSIINLLVFHNQRRLLKELYIPLTLQKIPTKEVANDSYEVIEYNLDFFIKHGKVLITDTAGMGKSTITKKLFLSVVDNKYGIPIHIELRRLKKDRRVLDEILKELKLLKNYSPEDCEIVMDLIRSGDFIFLFDGFDEIALEERDVVTNDIQEFIKNAGNNIFILTSRPEKALTSFGDFIEFKIKKLNKEEAYTLLRKYDSAGLVSVSLIEKLKETHLKNIEEFLDTPLLVSLLFAAYEYKRTIPFTKHVFYRQVYDALFDSHDLSKGDSFTRDKKTNLGTDDFHAVLRHIGYVCMKLNVIEFTKDEILLHIKNSREFNIGKNFRDSDFLQDLIVSVPLFNRDGLYYKWAHKSIQEYFAAQFIYLDAKQNQDKVLSSMFNSDDFLKYYNILDLYYDIDYKQFRKNIILPLLHEFLNFCDVKIKEIPKEEVVRRRSLAFLGEAYMIRISGLDVEPLDDESEDDRISSVGFKLLDRESTSKKINNFEFSVRLIDEGYAALNNILIYERRHFEKNAYLVDMLGHKAEGFVTQVAEPSTLDLMVTNLKADTFYRLADLDPTVCINTSDNFSVVNDIYEKYMSYSYILDYEQVKVTVDEIRSDIKKNESDDFYLSGI